LRRFYLYLVLLSFVLPNHAHANDERIDQLFAEYSRPGVPGAAVMVIKNGQPLHMKGYGLAALAEQRRADASSNYRLASLSKAFTALAVVILKERGLLQYDDPITKYLAAFPSYGAAITIRHLLNHQSGFKDYENLIPGGQQTQVTDADVVDLLRAQTSTYFTPGSQYRYSNGGYATLAVIVAQVSGRSYADFLSENVFAPLAMNHTVAFVDGANSVDNRAYGYSGSGSSFQLTDQSTTSAVLGDGGVYSSLNDLYNWDQALYGSQIVTAASWEEIFTPGRLSNGASTSYGFGWQIDTYRDARRLSHTGSSIGFRHALVRFPEKRLTVVVLVNRANVSPWTLADQISDLYWLD